MRELLTPSTAPDRIVVATGSGGTLAGLALGLEDTGVATRGFDVDADATTSDSSSDRLRLPVGATIAFALLRWTQNYNSAFIAPTPPHFPITTVGATQAGLRTRDGVGHVVMAETVSNTTFAEINVREAWAEVTALVAPFTSGGTFEASNLVAAPMENVWVLYVVYNHPDEPLRNINIEKVGSYIWAERGITQATFTLNDAPTPATPRGTMIVHGTNGQVGFNTGEYIRVDGHSITDALNPTNQVWNSSRSELGAANPFANPPAITTYNGVAGGWMGLDLELFSVDGALTPGVSSHVVQLGVTGAEFFYMNMVALAIEVVAPDIALTKTMTKVGLGTLVPSDELAVNIAFDNLGEDDALALVLSDAIPAGLTYVPGTLVLTFEGVDSAVTDLVDGDDGEVINGEIAARFDTLDIGQSGRVSFRVRIDAGLEGPTTITNEAVLRFFGALAPSSEIAVRDDASIAVDDSGDCACDETIVFATVNDTNGEPAGSIRCTLTAVGARCDVDDDGVLVVYPTLECR